VFDVKNIKVSTEYDKDGKVWRITYRKKDLSDKLIAALLKWNGGDRQWSKPETFSDNKHWVSADKELHAVYYGNPVYKLVVMNRDALHAKRVPKQLGEAESKSVDDDPAAGPKGEGEAGGKKKASGDPLDEL